MNRFVKFLLCFGVLPFAVCCAQNTEFRNSAESFIDKAYKAKTLEVEGEPLVVNLEELDCTTFVEYVVAAMVSGCEPSPNNEEYCKALEKIRYRGGVRDGYMSRLHYATEWITDNVKRGNFTEVTEEYTSTMGVKRLDFMSSHSDAYPMLKEKVELIEQMRSIEESISQEPYYYIPANQVESIAGKLKDGDIVLFMTNIPGLDFTHMGFVYKEEGKTKLLHASSKYKKVCVDPDYLADYVINNRRCTGIRVLRIK